MTRNADFKRVVRERMARTGESYTAALARLQGQADAPAQVADHAAARREQERVVARFFRSGRLLSVPARRKMRVGVLLELLRLFEPGREYPEPEINEILRTVHDDVAYLRRELVNYHYLERENGWYRVVAVPPSRGTTQRQEIPGWEAAWLPSFLSGGAAAPVSAPRRLS